MQISNKVKRIEESGIRKVFELSARVGTDVIDLSIGQPHFKTPDILKETAKKAIDNDFNSYTPTQGNEDLREKIALKLRQKNNIQANPDEVMITSGVSGGLFLLFNVVLNEDDEVILPDPYFVLYEQILKFLGVKIKFLDTYPDFRLSAKKMEKLISPKTKMIIINSPNNPTGMVYSEEELRQVAKLAKKNDLLIVSDEIYESFDHEKKFFSIAGIHDNTVTLNGFSKNLSVTGWRIGYAHGPNKIIQAMNKLQMYTFVCTSSQAQKAIAGAMDSGMNINTPVFDYSQNRDLLYENLKDKYELKKPEGAFYAFIKTPQNQDANEFCEKLVTKGLLTVPGGVFSQKNDHFRVSFAVDPKTLKKGIEILQEVA